MLKVKRMNKNLDLGSYEEIDDAISKHIKDNPEIDYLGDYDESEE